MKVFVDGVQAGRLAHGQRKLFPVFPGLRAVHVMVDWCASKPYHVDVKEGEIIELQCGPGSSAGSYVLNTLKALFTPNQFFYIERIE